MKGRLTNWVDLREGESKLFTLMAFHSALYGSGQSFLYTAATAIFLAQFDNIALLWAYVAIGAASMVLSSILSVIQKRLSSNFLFRTLLITVTIVCFAFWVGLRFAPALWIVFILMAWERIEYTFTRLEWLGIQGEVLTIQQGKRMLGTLNSIEMIGKVGTYILMPFLLAVIPTRDLLLVGAIVFGVIYVLLELILRLDNSATEEEVATADLGTATLATKEEPTTWWRDRYLISIFGSVGLLIMLQMTITFGVFSSIQLRFPTEAQVASFISAYYLSIYFAVFFIGPITQPILRRFGLGFGFSILPITVGIASVVSVGIGSVLGLESLAFFVAIVIAFSIFDILNTSFSNTSLVLLLQVTPPETQVRAKIGSQTVFTPLAIGLTGLLLLFLNQYELTNPLIALAIAAFICASMYVIATFVIRRYRTTLEGNFETIPFSGQELDLEDTNVVSYLRSKLHSPYPLEVKAALNMLVDAKALPTRSDLRRLLDHEDGEIRATGLEAIGELNYADMLPEIKDFARNDTDKRVLVASFKALCQLEIPEAVTLVGQFLSDGDDDIRQGAMLALLKYGGVSGIQKAGIQLLDYVNSPNPNERRLVIEAISDAQVEAYGSAIFPDMLYDDDTEIRRLAFKAVGDLKATKYISHLLEGLKDGHFAGTASKSLKKLGSEAAQPAKDMLLDPLTPEHIKYRLINVLGAINTPSINNYLCEHLPDADVDLRRNIYTALVRNRFQPSEDRHPELLKQYKAEMDLCAFLFGIRQTLLTAEAKDPTLFDAVNQSIADSQGHLIRAIGLLRKIDTILPAQRSLRHGTPTQQAIAIELFETLVPSQYRLHTNLLLDPQLSDQERWQKLQSEFPQYAWQNTEDALQQLIQAPHTHVNAWLRSCALNAIEHSHLTTLRAPLNAQANATNPLVQETAQHIQRQFAAKLAAA